MVSINLIPSEFRRARARRTRIVRWAAAVITSILLAAVPYSMTLAKKAHVANARKELDSLEAQTSALKSEVRLATAKTAEITSELDRSRALRAKRSWSGMLALIARTLPDECWLLSMATDPEAPTAAPQRSTPTLPAAGSNSKLPPPREAVVIEAPQKLRLVGNSTSDAPPLEFVSRLMESHVFSRVGLERTALAPAGSTAPGETLYQFEIVCEW